MARATKLDEPEKSIVGHGCPQKDWLLLKELDDIKEPEEKLIAKETGSVSISFYSA